MVLDAPTCGAPIMNSSSVNHCHILEHEDGGMMATIPEPRPLLKGPPPSDDSASRRVSLRRFLKAFRACFSVSLVTSSDIVIAPGASREA